jgi:phosphopantothenoylcysteine synthetase/decarboxylase
MIVGNIANHELKLGFESDYNQVTIFSKKQTVELPRAKKSDIAKSILKAIAVEISSNRIQLVNKDVK